MGTSALADWQVYAQESIVQILRSRGYLSNRFAKVTLAQRFVQNALSQNRIILSDAKSRLAFLVSKSSLLIGISKTLIGKVSNR